jgi:hypothetical protein
MDLLLLRQLILATCLAPVGLVPYMSKQVQHWQGGSKRTTESFRINNGLELKSSQELKG